jgi:NAD(P)-dependent dehydrogenase (short-subunit alcohol dehydrogenase family)
MRRWSRSRLKEGMITMSLAEQSVIIVGGTSGIGLATAKAALHARARVSIIGRDESRLNSALRELGDGCRGFAVDAGSPDHLREVFEQLGSIDHLILCASGARGAGLLADVDGDELRAGFDAKFWVQWTALRTSLPFLTKTGSVTFVTAASARVGNPGTSGLAAINGALNAMVLPLARELAPIRVNAVSPGIIDTSWWDARHPETKAAFFNSVSATTPTGRVGQPEEVAQALMYLMGARFTTGIIVDVDGGLRTTAP